MSNYYVIDTNVMYCDFVVLDEDGEILDEYIKGINPLGQKRAGDLFIIWLRNHQYSLHVSGRVAGCIQKI